MHMVELIQAYPMEGHLDRFLSRFRVQYWDSHLVQMVELRYSPPMAILVDRFLASLRV